MFITNERKMALEWLWTPKWERKLKYSEGENDRWQQYWWHEGDKMIKRAKRTLRLSKMRMFFTSKRYCLAEARPIKWQEEYSMMVPCCSRCNEPVYKEDHCVFCGQRFITNKEKSNGKDIHKR